MKKEAEQKKLQAERVDRRLVGYNYFLFIIYIFVYGLSQEEHGNN